MSDETPDEIPMTWHELKTQDDVDRLLAVFGKFHDSCITEIHLEADAFVGQDLSMGFRDAVLRVLFQRQYQNPSAIELRFEKVHQLYYGAAGPGEVYIIYSATFERREHSYYWSDSYPEKPSFIEAERVFWRDASEWMGPTSRYLGSSESDGQGTGVGVQ